LVRSGLKKNKLVYESFISKTFLKINKNIVSCKTQSLFFEKLTAFRLQQFPYFVGLYAYDYNIEKDNGRCSRQNTVKKPTKSSY